MHHRGAFSVGMVLALVAIGWSLRWCWLGGTPEPRPERRDVADGEIEAVRALFLNRLAEARAESFVGSRPAEPTADSSTTCRTLLRSRAGIDPTPLEVVVSGEEGVVYRSGPHRLECALDPDGRFRLSVDLGNGPEILVRGNLVWGWWEEVTSLDEVSSRAESSHRPVVRPSPEPWRPADAVGRAVNRWYVQSYRPAIAPFRSALGAVLTADRGDLSDPTVRERLQGACLRLLEATETIRTEAPVAGVERSLELVIDRYRRAAVACVDRRFFDFEHRIAQGSEALGGFAAELGRYGLEP